MSASSQHGPPWLLVYSISVFGGALWLKSPTALASYMFWWPMAFLWFGNEPSCQYMVVKAVAPWAFPISRSCDESMTQASSCPPGAWRCDSLPGRPSFPLLCCTTQAFVSVSLFTNCMFCSSAWIFLRGSHHVGLLSHGFLSESVFNTPPCFDSLCFFTIPINLHPVNRIFASSDALKFEIIFQHGFHFIFVVSPIEFEFQRINDLKILAFCFLSI